MKWLSHIVSVAEHIFHLPPAGPFGWNEGKLISHSESYLVEAQDIHTQPNPSL